MTSLEIVFATLSLVVAVATLLVDLRVIAPKGSKRKEHRKKGDIADA